MPHLNLHSDSAIVSRVDHKDEDTRALRVSVSVQMHISIEDLTHPSGCALGLSLFDLQEDPDTYNNAGKKIRILAPTVSGSGTDFQVYLDDTLLGSVAVPLMQPESINLVEFRFWKDVDKYKAHYFYNNTLRGTVEIPDGIFTPTLKFRAGVSIRGNADVKLYNISYSAKDAVARTVALQGSGTFNIPAGQSAVVLSGRGGPGKITNFKLDRVATNKFKKVLYTNILDDAEAEAALPLTLHSVTHWSTGDGATHTMMTPSITGDDNKIHVRVVWPNKSIDRVITLNVGTVYDSGTTKTISRTFTGEIRSNDDATNFGTITVVYQASSVLYVSFNPLCGQNSIHTVGGLSATVNYNNQFDSNLFVFDSELTTYKIVHKANVRYLVACDGYFYLIFNTVSAGTYDGTAFSDATNKKLYRTINFETFELVRDFGSLEIGDLGVVFHPSMGDVLYLSDNTYTRHFKKSDDTWFSTQTGVLQASNSFTGKIMVNGDVFLTQNLRYRSLDLINWRPVLAGNPPAATSDANKIIIGNGIIALATPVGADKKIYYTTDNCDSWQYYTANTDYLSLLFANGMFVIYRRNSTELGGAGQNGQIYAGTNFTTMAALPQYPDGIGISCGVVKNRFYLFRHLPNNKNVYVSSDFINFELVKTAIWGNSFATQVSGDVSGYHIKNNSDVTQFIKPYKDDVIVLNSLIGVFPKNSIRKDFLGALFETELSVSATTEGLEGVATDVTLQTVNYEFPKSKIDTTPAVVSRKISTTNSALSLDYSSPIGAELKVSFLDTPPSVQSVNKLLGVSCNGLDKVERYSDGNGGEYLVVIAKNSPDCGYVADTLKTIVLSGKGTITLPAGINTLTVDGRGSSMTPKTIGIAASTVGLNFDVINIPGFSGFTKIAKGPSGYVVLAGAINYTAKILHPGLVYATEIWAGATLESLTKLDLPASPDIKIHEVSYSAILDKFIITYKVSGSYKLLTCSTANPDYAQWTVTNYVYGTYPNAKKIFDMWNADTPHVGTCTNGTNYQTTDDGIVYTTRRDPPFGAHSYQLNSEFEAIQGQNGVIYHFGQAADTYAYTQPRILRTERLDSSSLYSVIFPITNGYSSDTHPLEAQEIERVNAKQSSFYSNYTLRDFAVKNDETYFGLVKKLPYDYKTEKVRQAYEVRPSDNWHYTGKLKIPSMFKSKFTSAATLAFGDETFTVSDSERVFYGSDTLNWFEASVPSDLKSDICAPEALFNKVFWRHSGQGLVYSSKIPTGEPYVVEFPILGRAAYVSVDAEIITLPGNTNSQTPATNTNRVVALNPGKENVIVYDCPPGSVVSITYMAVNDGAPAAGTPLGQFCNGYNLMGRYANGAGGEYTLLIEENNVGTCNYTPPVLKASISPTANVTLKEDESASIMYTLSQPLDVSVTLQLQVSGTAVAADIINTQVKQGSNTYPIAANGTFTLNAGVTMFTFEFTATMDSESEITEELIVSFVPTINAERIIGTNSRTITITNVNMVVDPSYIGSDGSDYTLRRAYGYGSDDQLRGTINRLGILRTQDGLTSGKYYLPLTGIDLKKMIIGVGASSAKLQSTATEHTYPGVDEYAWGITEGGYYHNGVFTAVPSVWNYSDNAGLLIDLDNKTLDLVINSVAQNFNITGLPADNLMVMYGLRDISGVVGFYSDLYGASQSSYTPPAGFTKGFGGLVKDFNFTPPNIPSAGVLTPDTLTSLLADNTVPVTRINAKTVARSSISVNSETWVVEFDRLASYGSLRIGICNASHPLTVADEADTATIQLGNNMHSYGIDIDINNAFAYHDSVAKPLLTSVDNATITLVIDLALHELRVNFGNGEFEVVYDNIPAGDWYVAVSTTTLEASGGEVVTYNSGQYTYNSDIAGLNPGFGAVTGTRLENTLLSTSCTGFQLDGVFADSSGGTITNVMSDYSFKCGYVVPANTVTGWDNTGMGPNRYVIPDGTEVRFMKSGTVKSHSSYSTGKYYFEITDDGNWVSYSFGIAQTDFIMTNTPGNDSEGRSIGISSGYVYQGGMFALDISTQYSDGMAGKTFGVMVDLDTGTLSILDGNANVIPITGTTPLTMPVNIVVGINTSYYQQVPINLGQKPFHHPLPSGYTAWFTP